MPPSRFSHDGLFWRELARLGASHGPEWWVRYSPPLFGLAAAALVPSARRAVVKNLERVRGKVSPLRAALDVAKTFSTYASCLAEVLSNGSKNGRDPEATIFGVRHMEDLVRAGKGMIFATAHTAGWELVGPLLARDHDVEIAMVMQSERDRRARAIHDQARRVHGVDIVHVGEDPLASLPLLRTLQRGGVVALQLDRVVPGMRTRSVRLFDTEGEIPEGLLRLAQLSGAPIVPVFSARVGYRRYTVEAMAPIEVPRRAGEAELDRAAARVADAMTAFVRAHPDQWFRFQA